MDNNRMAQAKDFRNERGLQGGYVVFCNEGISGWVQDLNRPSAWVPGCIAVDDSGNEYRAEGGDKQNGAQTWQYFFVSYRELPFIPISPEFESEEEAKGWLARCGDESMRLIRAGHL